MDVIFFLAVIVAVPIAVICGVQILIWKLIGAKALRALSAVTVLISAYLLVEEAFAPPIYGNKSALVGLGSFVLGILLIESLVILCAPVVRRMIARLRSIETERSAEPKI